MRDVVEKKMTAEQIAKAQHLVRESIEKRNAKENAEK
jgi:hypothetical protein